MSGSDFINQAHLISQAKRDSGFSNYDSLASPACSDTAIISSTNAPSIAL